LGVGVTTPLTIFDVKPSSNRHILFSDSAAYASNAIMGSNDAGGEIALGVVGSPIQFFSGAVERMRLTSAGEFLVNKTSDNIAVNGWAVNANGRGQLTCSGAGAPILRLNHTGPTGTEYPIEFFKNGSQVGSVSITSSNTSYNTVSDYRLKENVTLLTGATDRLQQIPVHRFNFIADPDKTVDGFLAHEVQAVVPECVTGTKDAVDANGDPVYQGIDQSKLVPLLTAALQGAIAEIETLKTRVTALEGGTN